MESFKIARETTVTEMTSPRALHISGSAATAAALASEHYIMLPRGVELFAERALWWPAGVTDVYLGKAAV